MSSKNTSYVRLIASLSASLIAGASLIASAQAPAPPAKPAPDVIAGIPVNYDESKVGSYSLPDPLKAQQRKPGARCEDVDREAASGNCQAF